MPLPSGAKLLYRNHLYPGVPLEYFGNNGWRIFRICGEDVVAADFEKGLAWGITALNSPHWSNQYLYNCVVLPPLIEWLGWHNIFMFHGGAVSWEEDGMLVMGPSGSGKTTVVLSLILAGFDFLTDDIGLLFEGDKSKVSGLPKPLNFCPDAPRLFSQISHLVPGSPGDDKQAVPLAAFAGTRSRKWCYPRIILLPEVRPESEVELIPISRQEAFDLVLPNGMFLTGLKEGSHRFSAFLHLLESTMPMRLILGKGISKLPGLIKDAFSTYKRSHGH